MRFEKREHFEYGYRTSDGAQVWEAAHRRVRDAIWLQGIGTVDVKEGDEATAIYDAMNDARISGTVTRRLVMSTVMDPEDVPVGASI